MRICPRGSSLLLLIDDSKEMRKRNLLRGSIMLCQRKLLRRVETIDDRIWKAAMIEEMSAEKKIGTGFGLSFTMVKQRSDGNDNDEVSIPKSLLAREFKTKDLGPLWYFLGIEAGRILGVIDNRPMKLFCDSKAISIAHDRVNTISPNLVSFNGLGNQVALDSAIYAYRRTSVFCYSVAPGSYDFTASWQQQITVENGSEEVKKRINMSFVKMSASFPDPTKAEDCFQKLHVMKDNVIFNSLVELLEEVKFESARTKRVICLTSIGTQKLFYAGKKGTLSVLQAMVLRSYLCCFAEYNNLSCLLLFLKDNLLRKIGDKHSIFGFLRLLSSKCSYNIFSSELVHYVLDHISSVRFGNKHLEDSSLKLLLNIISMFPPLLRGSEEQLRVLLLDEDIPLDEELIRIVEKQGARMSIKLSDIYPSLERVFLEGTRAQSKLAVSAIAALIDPSEQSILLELCKVEMSSDIGSSDVNSECSFSCKIKIFGLKALVKSFLPHQNIQVNRKSNELLEVILQMLQKGDVSDCLISCETDKAHIRLAAAKSVLRLSKRWDLHISPLIFRLTVLMAKDPSSLVRRSFVRKIYKLLKERALPKRYACAFALAASDALKDLQEDVSLNTG
ncbi:hypothetical protein RJ639_010651 [Escallonia herrerae]|uniref:Uncharacterized protein n=1 Tax=Escallonia herrerae TaxID=1293975 RepID=A0AA89ARJ7_9ASTE|nr:hypothetical protein RJ639_010651 [Escallonia herrerae]